MVAKINRLISRLFAHIAVIAGCLTASPVVADNISLITDAETQDYLAQIVKPLYQAANLTFNPYSIFLVNDNSLNAFVSDGNYLFVHTGTLIEAENTNEIAGILAHETGHIMGGHIVRQKLKLEKLQYAMLGSMLVAGATALSTGRGDAAMAVLLGSQSSAFNNMLNYQMQEERSADESAVKLLQKTKQSTLGLQKFMKKIKKKNYFGGIEENTYFRTHPLTSERIAHFIEASKNNKYPANNPLDSKFSMIKAKLIAFLLPKEKVRRMYPTSNTSLPAQYAHSIVLFREGNIQQSLDGLEKLITAQPHNPYLHELKGQFLFESGSTKQSISAYQQALTLLPNNYILQISLAHAILESSASPADIQQAVNLLQKSLVTVNNAFSWELLARAYDMQNNKAAAQYATAEFNYAIGKLENAQAQLERAENSTSDKGLKLKISDLKQRIKTELKEKRF